MRILDVRVRTAGVDWWDQGWEYTLRHAQDGLCIESMSVRPLFGAFEKRGPSTLHALATRRRRRASLGAMYRRLRSPGRCSSSREAPFVGWTGAGRQRARSGSGLKKLRAAAQRTDGARPVCARSEIRGRQRRWSTATAGAAQLEVSEARQWGQFRSYYVLRLHSCASRDRVIP